MTHLAVSRVSPVHFSISPMFTFVVLAGNGTEDIVVHRGKDDVQYISVHRENYWPGTGEYHYDRLATPIIVSPCQYLRYMPVCVRY
jgi:hypothetical protein